MKNLLMKEFRLAAHPTVYLFLALSPMLLIPNYPYYVVFFYMSLAVYFTCLSGRENGDISYTCTLPVKKRAAVGARILFCVIAESAQLVLCIPFAILRQGLDMPGNLAGMDANIALFGLALIMTGLFNLVFFTKYYSAPEKVGRAFIFGSGTTFIYICLAEAAAHAVPFFREKLDTPDPLFLPEKLTVLAVGAALYALMTFAAYKISARRFEALDL